MKLLITTIGKGQFNKETQKYDYKTAVYKLPDGKVAPPTKLVSSALKEFLKPDKVYVIGTSESLWHLADELIGDYERVEVPFGKSPHEFWEMFRRIANIEVEGKKVYLDITHGFRSIPLMVSTIINLFTKVKGAEIKGIYYGIFEAKAEDGTVPVVDLLPVIELNEWIEGFTLFANYGDGLYIQSLIEEKLGSLKPEDKKKLSKVSSLSKVLNKYSQAVGFNAPSETVNSFQKIISIFKDIKGLELPEFLYPLELLEEAFLKEAKGFEGIEREWEKQLRFAKWLFDKKRYAQSVIVLEESMFTYVLETLGFDPIDKVRKRLGGLFKKDRKRHELFIEEFNSLFSKIQDLRNKSGHAFMKENVSDGDFTESISRLGEYLDKSFDLLLHKDCIKDPEKVRHEIVHLYSEL